MFLGDRMGFVFLDGQCARWMIACLAGRKLVRSCGVLGGKLCWRCANLSHWERQNGSREKNSRTGRQNRCVVSQIIEPQNSISVWRIQRGRTAQLCRLVDPLVRNSWRSDKVYGSGCTGRNN